MEYRKLGKTNILVSEIGFGAWGIGGSMWQDSKDFESIQALYRAFELGINFVDTALAYGEGHSEDLVGRVVKEWKQKIYIATKIPPKNRKWPAQTGTLLHDVFPYDYIIECTEKSLSNLGVDTIDIQQFHVWNDEWTNETEWQDAVAKLKEEGKIRFFGISINDHQPENALKVAKTGLIDTFQVIYNIFDQSPEEKLFPVCMQENIGVIARVPLDEGGLTGKITLDTAFPKGDFRNHYFRGDRKRQLVERVENLKKLLGKEAKSLPELALRFCLNHPAVSTVIPGMRTMANVEMNCKISNGVKLSNEIILELKKHVWSRNFYE